MAARVTELKVLNDALGDAGEPRRRIDEMALCSSASWGHPRKIRDPRRRILKACEAQWLARGGHPIRRSDSRHRGCQKGTSRFSLIWDKS